MTSTARVSRGIPGVQPLHVLRLIALATLMVAAGNATTIYTAPQIFDTGLKTTTGAITNLTFAMFDPSLGALTDVYIQLDGYAEAGYQFTDLSGATNDFQFIGDVTVTLANPLDPAHPLAVTIPALSDVPRSVVASGTYSSPGFTNIPIIRSLTANNSTGTIDFTASSVLAMFQGPGTINLPASGSISWNFHANGDAQTGVSSRYIGSATLYYGYTPLSDLPEPGTYGLLLGGLGALGALAMRRR
jgi:hypothetical protein